MDSENVPDSQCEWKRIKLRPHKMLAAKRPWRAIILIGYDRGEAVCEILVPPDPQAAAKAG